MTEKKSLEGSVESSPSPAVVSPSPPSSYEPSHVIQLLALIQRDQGAMSAKIDRVIKDIEKLDTHVDVLRHQFILAKGIFIGGAFLLTVCGGLVWWLIGGQLNDIRDSIYQQNNTIIQKK
jgi:hypothetical protein